MMIWEYDTLSTMSQQTNAIIKNTHIKIWANNNTKKNYVVQGLINGFVAT